ncbi:hypothetical protein HK098_006449 [Nowakowskiella sp. JEL0407]|nr:hypothetical protein HK098_006449 [Nowakowskiella sp. JEL0407]
MAQGNTSKMIRTDYLTSASYHKSLTSKEPRQGEHISTSQASFQGVQADQHSDEFKEEKSQYEKNKEKSTRGGDWWGIPDIYESGKVSKPASVQNSLKIEEKGNVPSPDSSDWMQFRRKKPINDGNIGKPYDILSGKDSDAVIPKSDYDPLTVQMQNSRQIQNFDGNKTRDYNIISNNDY